MNVCRLCDITIESDSFENIFSENLDPPLWKIIANLANLTILESDSYTKIVCFQCFDKLQQFHIFRKIILHTDWKNRHRNDNNRNNNGNTEQLPENVDNYYNDCAPVETEGDDCVLKEEIKTEEHLLKIENHIDQDHYNSEDVNHNFYNTDHNNGTGINHKNDNEELENVVAVNVNGEDNHNNNNNNSNAVQFVEVVDNNSMKIERDDDCFVVEEAKEVDDDTSEIENQTDDNFNVHLEDDLKLDHSVDTVYECTVSKVHLACYKCGICDKKFAHKNTLTIHMRQHTGDKPFICPICDKAYARIDHLKQHLKVHSNEKPYKCNICDRGFTVKNNLKAHLRLHTGDKPFKCNICDKQYTRSDYLKQHLKLHTGEKPFKCNICDKGFTKNYNLRIHSRVHTGEKPYYCDICDQRFSNGSGLKLHLMKKHNS